MKGLAARRPSSRDHIEPVIAIIDWTHLLEDFLDKDEDREFSRP